MTVKRDLEALRKSMIPQSQKPCHQTAATMTAALSIDPEVHNSGVAARALTHPVEDGEVVGQLQTLRRTLRPRPETSIP